MECVLNPSPALMLTVNETICFNCFCPERMRNELVPPGRPDQGRIIPF